MRKILAILGIALLVCACKEEKVQESLQILIQNKTDRVNHVRLFPKGDIGGLYPICEDCGEHQKTEFDLPSNSQRVLFSSYENITIAPYALATETFDSIYITLKDTVIKFTHQNVIGYSENIFSENSTWDFKIEEWLQEEMFRKNPQKGYMYRFLIEEDKIIVE